jgi:hypothetical protein
MRLYRAMIEAADGLPEVGPTARSLGVRPGGGKYSDVAAILPSDPVVPGAGGMSATPHDLMDLPSYRLPRSQGGTGNDPVWSIELDDLDPDLQFRPDSAVHGLIEPVQTMTLQSFQQALQRTRRHWRFECR